MSIKLKLASALALMSALLIGCSGSSGGSNSDVTLSGVVSTTNSTTSAPGGVNKTVGGVTTAAASLTGYTLYCVTFTSTPQSGTGALTLDSSTGNYTYSVTLTNSAGLPIGCFINDANNAPVSTVTFNVSGSTGMSSTTSGAALTSGSHTVNITFNPTTGASTATVASTDIDSSATTSGGTATSMLGNLAGGWTISCPGTLPSYTQNQSLTSTQYGALSDCQKFLYTSGDAISGYTWSYNSAIPGLPIYLNFVSGTMNGTDAHAMAVWDGMGQYTGGTYADAYTACGSTEGMDQSTLTAQGVTGISQVDSPTTPPTNAFDDPNTTIYDLAALIANSAYTVGPDPTTGQTVASTTLANLITAIPPSGYDPTWNDQWVGTGTDWCPDSGTGSTLSTTTLNSDQTSTGAQERSCYVGWVEYLAESNGPGSSAPETCMPRIDGNAAQNAIWGTTGSAPFPTAANITVNYRTSLGGITPQIGGRFTLMGLNLVSNTAVATNHEEQQWGYWDSVNNVQDTCNYAEDMSITMIPDTSASPYQAATGHFTIKDYLNCVDPNGATVNVPGSGNTYATFDANFTR